MKKITLLKSLLMAVLLMAGSVGVFSQGTEDFEEQTVLTATYADGNFVNSTSGITWTYGHSRNEETYAITNKGIMLRRASDSYLQATFAAGVGTFNFQYRKAFTGTSVRQLELIVNETQVSVSPEFGTISGAETTIYDFSYAVNTAGPVTIKIKNVGTTTTNRQTIIDNISWTAYSGSGTPTVATPTFNPGSGSYLTTQNVTISTTTADASIYYTTNGDDPTELSTPYTVPVEVSTTTTLKAKAFKAGMDPSEVATAVYTFPEEVADIATLRTKATGSTPYRLTGEAVLTLQTSTRNAKYIQDGTGAVLIDDASGVITTAYNLGDGITGITGTLAVYREMLQFVPIADPGAATSTGNVVSPVLVELSNLGNYQAQLVKIENVTIDGTGDFTAGTSYNLNGAGNPVLRTQYGDLDYIGSPIPAGGQDIVGVVLVYDAINQFVPRSLADFAPSSGATVPTINVSVTELSGFDYEVSTGGPSAAQQFTVSGSNLTDDLLVAAPGNFEVSLTGNYEEYNPWVAITPVDGTVEATTIYVRLFSSLTKGNYGGDVNISSVGATMKTVALSGSVFEPIALPNVIISEVYGGGGNSGATFTNDFIELYNTTNENVEIGGWSVQYFSATGTSANVFVIPDGRYIPPFTHFLIQCAGGATGIPLPVDMVDATCTLNLSGSAGKVILYNASEAQEISDINSIIDNPAFVDYVPYGTNATPVWGSPMSSNISSSTSAARRENIAFAPQARVASAFVDYIYTGNIGNDFSASSVIIPQGTGITSAVTSALQTMAVYAANGKVHFTAAAGEVVEIYNAVGQRVVNTLAVDGLNSIAVEHSGVMIVKAGNRIAKVIL